MKNHLNKDVVRRMARSLQKAYPQFQSHVFLAVEKKLPQLELKERVSAISSALQQALPKSYPSSVEVLLASLQDNELHGFALWPYTQFIQDHGLHHRDLSLKALAQLTPLFTSEFAIRPFIKKEPQKTLAYLLKCTQSSNTHLRRWSSEGSRPRLPWGERLDLFIQNPKLTLPILEKLKYDGELYVRKSVANHLNDIAKDHPQVVLKLLNQWKSKAPLIHQEKIDWIIRHSLRTLIKQGNSEALKLIGVNTASRVKISDLEITKPHIYLGDSLEFKMKIELLSSKKQKLVVDYILHHRKANGKMSGKVFKLKTFELEPNKKMAISKSHPVKKITTRKYYPGLHRLEIQINGKLYGSKDWFLKMN